MVAPKDFISVLEDTGMIVQVGSWVVAQACKQIGVWLQSAVGPIQVSVNVSGRQFVEGDLDGNIIAGLAMHAIPADLLELELTETSLMAQTERTIEILQSVKQHGGQVSIDDFGTGYSSLAYLRCFPIDKLKIDMGFIRDVTTNPDDAAIVLAIINLAHSLKLDVIAEGVETAAQLNYLRRHHCDQIQGHYFSAPLTAEQATEVLLQDTALPPAQDSGQSRKTLLIIDDDPVILEALAILFSCDGYRILCAPSGADGFDLLTLNEVQVILCDQRMPAMSGTDFLDKVKQLYPKTFRIVLSGHTDLESIMEAVNGGAVFRFYTKPWDNKLLRDNVRDAFRQFAAIG